MKRIISMILAVVMVLAVMPVSVFAASEIASGTCGENLTWTLADDGVLTISGTGEMEDYYFTSSAPWYSYSSSIKSVIIEDGVTSIGNYAFLYCSSLTSITIPDSVTSIGNYAFGCCSSLTSVTIPDGVTSIGNYAFSSCSSLTSITIPDTVTYIGGGAFSGCSSLTSITIPDRVINIGSYAFEGCSSLTSIIIPHNVSSIGWGVFMSCNSLSEITFMSPLTSINDDPETVPATATIYGYNDSLAEAYAQMYDRTFVSLGDAPVTTVASGTCGENLTWELNSKGVLTISGTGEMENYYSTSSVPWYSYRSSIKSVIIEDSVTSIGDSAFSDCSRLTSVTIGSGVTSIGDSAFSGCSSLTSITIPDSVTNIGWGAFWGCSSITSVTIPDGVTDIGDYAFFDCSSLTSITIPDTVTYIGGGAFSGCSSLTSVTIPDGVTSIGNYAFEGCSSLTSIIIPHNVSSIGWGAFRSCNSLSEITFMSSQTSIYDDPEAVPATATIYGYNDSPAEAYAQKYDRTFVSLGDAPVTTVASGTCGENLTWELNSKGVLTISGTGEMENYYSTSSVPWYSYRSSIKSVIIEDGVTSIGYYAFRNCSNLTSITIPDSVTNIGNNALFSCSNLITIEVDDANEYYADIDGVLFDKSLSTLIQYPAGKTQQSYTIPESVKTIEQNAFNGCSSLMSITIPEGLQVIRDLAFQSCSGIVEIVIPQHVSSIGWGAFISCNSLSEITFMSSLTSIYDDPETVPATATIYGYNDSPAEAYAQKYDRTFVSLGDAPVTTVASGTCGENLTWELNSKGVLTISGTGAMYAYGVVWDQGSITAVNNVPWATYCDQIKKVAFEEGVTEISPFTFRYVTEFTSNGLSYKSMNNLEEIDICASMEYFPLTVSCASLVSINVADSNEYYCDVDGILYDKSMTTLIMLPACHQITDFEIPSTVTTVTNSIDNSNLKSIIFPVSVSTAPYIQTDSLESITFLSPSTYIYDSQWAIVAPNATIYGYNDSPAEAYAQKYDRTFVSLGDAPITTIASGTCGENLTWEFNSKGVLSISGTGEMDDYYSTSSVPWYSYRSSIKSVIIEDSVTSIGYYAFRGCSSLTSITIPNSVTNIGNNALFSCSNLITIEVDDANEYYADIDGVLFDKSLSTLIQYPAGKTQQSYTIPESVKTIEQNAFNGCSSLMSITIPEGLQVIRDLAFQSCSGIVEIVIPQHVSSIGWGAFMSCNNLSEITFTSSLTSIYDDPETVPATATIYGYNDSPAEAYAQKYDRTFVSLGDAPVTTIASGTCGENLTWELNSKGVLTISGTGEMENYYSTSSVPWYSYRSSIKSVIIEDSVTSIGRNAFWGYSNITNINIPDSVTYIGWYAFAYCSSLTAIEVDDTNEYYADVDGVLFDKSLSTLVQYPAGKTQQSYVIPDGVISVGDSAFEGCTKLINVTIPDSVTSIGYYAFWGCSNITSITIPDSVTSIGYYAFNGCSRLTAIEVDDTNEYYADVDGVLFDKSLSTLIQYPAGKTQQSYVIPDGVISVGDSAFEDCANLINITIPDSVTSIGWGAFWGCSNITSITIPESVGSIGDYAFYDCVSLESVIFKNPNIEICDDTWTVCDNAVIYGYDNSTAQAYAEKYGKEFVSLGSLAMNGNLDGNLTVDKNDAIYLLYSVLFGEDTYPLNQTCDFNGDGSVDKNDAIYLLYHALFGAESYPLN